MQQEAPVCFGSSILHHSWCPLRQKQTHRQLKKVEFTSTFLLKPRVTMWQPITPSSSMCPVLSFKWDSCCCCCTSLQSFVEFSLNSEFLVLENSGYKFRFFIPTVIRKINWHLCYLISEKLPSRGPATAGMQQEGACVKTRFRLFLSILVFVKGHVDRSVQERAVCLNCSFATLSLPSLLLFGTSSGS